MRARALPSRGSRRALQSPCQREKSFISDGLAENRRGRRSAGLAVAGGSPGKNFRFGRGAKDPLTIPPYRRCRGRRRRARGLFQCLPRPVRVKRSGFHPWQTRRQRQSNEAEAEDGAEGAAAQPKRSSRQAAAAEVLIIGGAARAAARRRRRRRPTSCSSRTGTRPRPSAGAVKPAVFVDMPEVLVNLVQPRRRPHAISEDQGRARTARRRR